MDTTMIYENLAGVNLTEQEKIWDERGKGYYGEYLVFRELFNSIPGDGKFLMNLDVPKQHGGTTEVDLLFIHETGVYVFEIKHYKGTIYGNEKQENWVQYFRTVKNNPFYNPILQNTGHINALEHLLPNIEFNSYVVFTNPECELKIKNGSNVPVVYLSGLVKHFNATTAGKKPIYNKAQISALYESLLPCSKVVNAIVAVDSDTMTLPEYLDTLARERDRNRQDYKLLLNDLHEKYSSKKKSYLKRCLIATLAVIIAAAGFAFAAIKINKKNADNMVATYKENADNMVATYKQAAEDSDALRIAAEKETAEMRKNFEHVKPWNNGDFEFKEDIVSPEIVLFADSQAVKSAVELQINLVAHSKEYGLYLTPDAAYVVQLKNGDVKEYSLFPNNAGRPLNPLVIQGSIYWPVLKLGKMVLNEVSKGDIVYIKLKGLTLYNTYLKEEYKLKDNIELEIYSR